MEHEHPKHIIAVSAYVTNEKGRLCSLKPTGYRIHGKLLDPDIAEIEIHANGGTQEVRPDISTSQSGTRIFLWVGDERLEDITYRATGYNGDVLYAK